MQNDRPAGIRSSVTKSFDQQDLRRGDSNDQAAASMLAHISLKEAVCVVEAQMDRAEQERMAGKAIPMRVCSECGELIEEKRLRAKPFTVECINCATANDPMSRH